MVRIIGFLVGLAFAGVLLISLVVNLVAVIQSPPEPSAEPTAKPWMPSWTTWASRRPRKPQVSSATCAVS